MENSHVLLRRLQWGRSAGLSIPARCGLLLIHTLLILPPVDTRRPPFTTWNIVPDTSATGSTIQASQSRRRTTTSSSGAQAGQVQSTRQTPGDVQGGWQRRVIM